MEKGTVIKSTGSWYQVLLDSGEVVDSRIIGKFRLDGKRLTNPVAVGDEVEVDVDEKDETATIRSILPRRNYVVRQSPRRKHDLHLLASNVDQAIVIVTIVQPNLKQGFIDRFLLMTEPYEIPTVIIFNKADLYEEEELAIYEYLKEIYEQIGYKVLLTSAIDGQGLEELRHTLKDKVSLISGQSGVGKSTLVNAIQPQLELRTQELSDYSGKGQHTTTFAEMFPLDFGGQIIDTPGIKMLAFNNLLVNLSSYTGRYSENYYLYKNEQGQFVPILYDLNLCFGSYKNTGIGSDLKLKELSEMDPLLHIDNPAKPLISRLLGNEEYQKIYLAHIRTMMSDFFRREQYAERAKELQDLIRKDFEEDTNRYYSMEDFNASLTETIGKRSRIPGLKELMGPRTAYLKENALLSVVPPEVTDVSVSRRERFSSEKVTDFKIQARIDKFPKNVVLYYRFDHSAPFSKAEMRDDGKHNDGEAEDNVFGAVVKPNNGSNTIEYYIFAENAKAVAFDPPRYMHEQHTASLEDLNN